MLKAVIAFKGLMIEWVIVKAHSESNDLWTESRYKVFKKVTENCHAAMCHFHSPTMPDLAVRSFMVSILFGNSDRRVTKIDFYFTEKLQLLQLNLVFVLALVS